MDYGFSEFQHRFSSQNLVFYMCELMVKQSYQSLCYKISIETSVDTKQT